MAYFGDTVYSIIDAISQILGNCIYTGPIQYAAMRTGSIADMAFQDRGTMFPYGNHILGQNA